MSANESLGALHELQERFRSRSDELERLPQAEGRDDAAIDILNDLAEIAKQILAEVQRARASADAGA